MARKNHSPEPEQAASAASEETSGDFAKTDKECCGPCPPPKQRCPTKVEKVLSRMLIPKSRISSSIGGPVSIDEIEIGKVAIRDLEFKSFEGKDFTFESCAAMDVDLKIDLILHIEFSCDISIDWLPDPSASGSMDIEMSDQTYQLGNITIIPSDNNEKFSMHSTKTTSMDFSMTSKPVMNTKVDEITTRAVKMKCTSIPLETPLCTDLGVCLPIPNPMCPINVINEETEIKRLDSEQISCPRIEIDEINLSNINIPTLIVDKPINIKSDTKIEIPKTSAPQPTNLGGDAGRAYNINSSYSLTITRVEMNIKGGLEFNNVKGAIIGGPAISDKIDDINLLLKGIKIKGLNLCGMKIPEIEVEF